ncbi:MAG: phosphodiester glycosidase family protein [Coraliomargarita sp.]
MQRFYTLLALFLAPACFSAPRVTVLPSGAENPTSDDGPIIVWSEQFDTPRLMVVHFLRIDLTDPELETFVQLSPDPDGPGPAEGTLTLPETLMEDPAILALINANAFSRVPSIPKQKGKKGWHLGRHINIEGLTVADGEERSADQADRMPFWIDIYGKPHLGHPKKSDKVQHAVADWFSPLIVNGEILALSKASDQSLLDETDLKDSTIDLSIHPRSMLGFGDTGEWLLLAVVDGRRKGYSLGMTLEEQAILMQEKGCSQAINLDGGGSSIMIIRNGNGDLVTVNRPSGSSHRPIPVMIGVRLRQEGNPQKASETDR